MGETQNGFKYAQQGATCRALLFWRAGLDLGLGNFKIPVTVLIPDQVV